MLDVKRNLTTMTDFYELTMSAGYLDEGYKDKIAVFDMFFRKVPDGGGYAIMAGLEQFINAVDSLKFTEEDINYLRSTGAFNEQFLDYLRNDRLSTAVAPLSPTMAATTVWRSVSMTVARRRPRTNQMATSSRPSSSTPSASPPTRP